LIFLAASEEHVRGDLARLVNTLQADPAAGRHLLAEVLSPVTLAQRKAAGFSVPSGARSFQSLSFKGMATVTKLTMRPYRFRRIILAASRQNRKLPTKFVFKTRWSAPTGVSNA
jgi:hypothetical protein